MRLPVLLVALLATGVTSGCMGLIHDDSHADNETTTQVPVASLPHIQAPPALPQLRTTVTASLPFPSWVNTGQALDVSATEPADAKGPLTWSWLVGPVLGTAPITQKATGIDTGSKTVDQYLSPGASATLSFSIPGVYQMHCHPHAFMRSNVTVIDGLAGVPTHYDVYIEDGGNLKEFRFVPENLTVPKGATVTYHNAGSQAHTATELSQDPALKLTPLTTSKGTVTLQGNGWTRVVAIIHDAAGRIGQAEYRIYVAPYPEEFRQNYTYASFSAGLPGQLDSTPGAPANPSDSKSFKLDYNGTIFLNITAADAAAAQTGNDAANTALIEAHLREQGSQQDVLSCTPATASCSVSGHLSASTYNLIVIARQGAKPTAVASITTAYDHVPPPILPYVDPESIPHTH